MRPRAPTLLVSVAVGCAVTVAAEQATFRARVALVRLQVLVTQEGRPLPGLVAADFEVTDDGVRQDVEVVFAEQRPIDVLLVMDRSASMTGVPLARLKAAAHDLVDNLRPDDRCGLLTFSHRVTLDEDLTSDRSRMDRALDDLRAEGLTSMLDAIYGALHVGLDTDRRMLILLFSDGLDSHSWTLARDATVLAQQSEALIAAVAFDPGRPPRGEASDVVPPNVPLLRSIARDTGGEVIVAARPDEFSHAFASIIERARSRYLISYYPQGAWRPGWHEVNVKLRSRRGAVVARRGYDVPAGEGHKR